ncbi:tetratricopeptide repeat protein [Anabaena azotica]|uniref:Tetratricopeptide repeat protein n=1 Tax=Anabaena azotica FACHB-119 TaxID=947527 RepID=A0ABR8DEG0_9NOST|nr:hypothetical protein [Anabaena azotica]MBD2505016.1 hypothetical protein [Anabaena azotica FACHB-119]
MISTKAINKLLISLLLVVSNSTPSWSQQQNLAKSICIKPVGRIINGGDALFKAGRLICLEDKIQPANGYSVEVLCHNSRRIVIVTQSNQVKQICGERVSQPRELCVPTESYCFNTRNPQGRKKPTLITPYVGRIINPQPLISWLDVPGATSYTVKVEGAGVNWSRKVVQTSLEYPKSEPAMQKGRIYKINVIANNADGPEIATSSHTIVIPQKEEVEIKRIIEQVQNLNLAGDELAMDLDTVYMSKNLLTEAIGSLKARIEGGSSNPTIYRMLGDRYRETGLLEPKTLEAANNAYRQALSLAQKQNNTDEIAKAQTALEFLEANTK